jgi:hypothetical protein
MHRRITARLRRPHPKFLRVITIAALIGAIIGTAVVWREPAAHAISSGDGLIFYGASGNTNPQVRSFTNATPAFGAAGGTVSGTTPLSTVMRTSPTKGEAIAGYLDSAGNLKVLCYDGATWSAEFTVAVGGTGTTRRFDIAYETTSGDAIVLYSTNTASATNPMNYRTKLGSTGCGAANWSGATNLPATVKTSGTVQWVKLATNPVSGSNLIAASWADSASDMSTFIWSGTAWGNEPAAALETAMEFATAAQDTDAFDITYESLSGDVMLAWGTTGTGATNLSKYATCTALNVSTVADAATNIDISSNPESDEIALAAVDNGSADGSAGYWSGTAWTGYANHDTSLETPTAGEETVSTFWLNDGSPGHTKFVVIWDDSAGTALDWSIGTSIGLTAQTDAAVSPAFNNVRTRYASEVNPFDHAQAMLTLTDASNTIYAKRFIMNSSTGVVTLANADGASLGTPAANTPGDFSFAYWRTVPVTALNQSAYRWMSDMDSPDYQGIISNPAGSGESIEASALDATGGYIYTVGGDAVSGPIKWRIEKRLMSNGSLVTAFDSDGVVNNNLASGKSGKAKAIAIDTAGGYMYVGGYEQDTTTNEYTWRIEKRSLTTGAYDTNFGTGGALTIDAVTSASQAEQVNGITIDTASGYLIAVGYQTSGGTQSARIEKRSLATGALGWTALNPATFTVAYAVVSDGTNFYTAGYDSANGGGVRVDKRLISTGAGVVGFGTNGVQLGNINANLDIYYAIAYDGTNLYLAGRDNPAGTEEEMLLEKRSATTGALVTAFNTTGRIQVNPSTGTDQFNAVAADSNAVYVAGRISGTDVHWYVRKFAASNGASDATFGTLDTNPTPFGDELNTMNYDSTGGAIYIGGIASTVWRWEKHSSTTAANSFSATALGANNTAITAPAQGTSFRLRMLLHASLNNVLTDGTQSWKLQVAARSGATCEASGGGESYADISTSSGAIRFSPNSADPYVYATTATSADPSNGDTIIPETYKASNNFAPIVTATVGQSILFDFDLVDNSAPSNTAYCFKAVNSSDGSDIATYTQIPMLTTAAASVTTPTTDQLMGGGAYFNNETKQSLSW